jgi:iron complex outermembrane receptor protein
LSPAQNLPDILAQQTGVQIQHLAGSRSAVDLRGFGAFAHSNVLILVNGRRYQDFDLQGFDLASIPLNSIERIEVTRGNSGAVLYGDGAIGGVINIVTKNGVGLPPAARVEGVFGSYGRAEGRASANTSWGPWSTSVAANVLSETGYRKNSQLRQQNVVGRLDYQNAGWGGYLNIAADNQEQGLPGGLFNFNPIFPFTLATPRESITPFDIGDKQGINFTGGVVVPLAAGADLTVDGGVRRKFQQAQFFNYFQSVFPFAFDPASATPANYVDTVMTTTSLTPRLDLAHGAFGVPNRLLTGVDIYDTKYDSDRSQSPRTPVIHRYDIRQTTVATTA